MKIKQAGIATSLLLMSLSSYAQITNPAPYCDAGYDDENMKLPHYITKVTFGTLTNNSGNTQYTGKHYVYYNNITAPNLAKGTSYALTINHDGGGTIHWVFAFIDFNKNNSFADAGECVLQQSMLKSTVTNPATVNVTIPAAAATGQTRMRIMVFEDDKYTYKNPTTPTPCTADATGSFDWGETEDYDVNITGTSGTAPKADFKVSAQNGSTNTLFAFTDMSTNTPTGYTWTFTPNTVTYQSGTSAGSASPVVKFTAKGTYSVKLKASNASGADSVTKSGYVIVFPTGVESISTNNQVAVYPNPAKDVITVGEQYVGGLITVYDMYGKLLLSETIHKTTVNISSLPAGLYLVRLQNDGELNTEKLCIEK